MSKTTFSKRIMALFMALSMVIGLMPVITLPVLAVEQANLTVIDKVADPSSFDNWKDYYGENSLLPDGTRGISTWKAGGVWTDKSVYADSSEFVDSGVTMDNQANNFLVALSALASNKEIVGQSSTPTDTMLVLDLSQSMDNSGSVEDMIKATNETIDALLKMNVNNRVGVVLYSGNSNTSTPGYTSSATVILPLDHYTTTTSTTERVQVGGRWTQVTRYQYLTVEGSNDTTVSVADGTRNSNKVKPNTGSKNTNGGTYIQNGLFKAWQEFEDMDDKGVVQSGAQAGVQRQPILILMSDGRPTLATEAYNNIGTSERAYGDGRNTSTTDQTVFLTQLTAAWVKGAVKDHYNNADVKFYTLGLSTGNDNFATNVLNPSSTTSTDMLTWWTNFINGTKRNDGTVRVQNSSGWFDNSWDLPYDNDRFATSVGRNYTDGYWSAADVDEMIEKFQQIVAEIGLQSAYSATLVESGEADLDGYITVQDELGAMMQVKDVKGILIGDTLFSGKNMAESLNKGALGSVDTPTAYGDEFVRTVKERLGLTDKTGANGETITATSQAQQLIQAAYMDGQLSYNTATGAYSNYIGWYGNADNAYLGFWDKDTGITATGAPEDAKYINKSYGYLGGASTEEDAADMMHIVVMVRTEITTGHQTVVFKIPSSLIPMVEYKVELDGDSLETANESTLTVEEKDPIRLVYEVGLPDDVNSININQKVEEYLAKDDSNHIHKDADGNYVFYANGWDDNHDDVAPVISNLTDAQKLELTKYVAESHFVPNTANERFYVQENSVVYTKNGNNYTPVTNGINANGTYYFARTIVTIVDGKAQAVTQYEQLQPATVAVDSNFQRNGAGQWEVKAGTIRQQLSNMILPKTDENGDPANLTGTIANTDQLWVNVTSNDPSNYNIYSFLGNNGKLTVAPATGIKVTKDVTELADGASADEEFEIQVLLDWTYSNNNVVALAVTDAEGNLLDGSDYTITASQGNILITLYLADGESALISGLPGGVTYTVAEAAHKKYMASYAGATATVAGTIVEGVVTNAPLLPGNLYITKEVVHSNGGEVFPTDYEFKFAVTFIDVDGNPIANTKFQLENNYDANLTELFTDENGVMTGYLRHGETVYIKNIPAGATVTVEEVEIPDKYNKTEPVYRSRNFSGDTADNDGVVTITSGANATVVVTNTYTPDEVGVKISFKGTKNFDAINMSGASDFTFKLQEYVNGQWPDVEGKTVTIAGGTENASESFAFTDLNLEFDKPGVHSYQIIEVKGDNTDITYDRSVYTFSVNVVINNNGDLKAEVVGHNEKENAFDVSGDSANGYVVETVFTNYYHKTATSIEINKTIEDKANSGKTPAGFVIETYNADANWTIGEKIRETVTDAQGKALLVRNYDNDDFIANDTDNDNVVTYHFIIKEQKAGTVVSGWTYDATVYRVTVVLTKAADETISADFRIVKVTAEGQETLNVSGDTATINFANTYDPTDAEIGLNTLVQKDLDGRDMTAGEFQFAIFENGKAAFDANGNLTNVDKALAVGTNDAAGNVAFTPNKLTFSKIGKYEYDIIEVKGSLGGVTYDATIYDLVVEVTDNGDGTLNADYYFEDAVEDQVTFRNTYTTKPVEVVIDGQKTLTVLSGAKTLNAGDYTFQLFEANAQGEPVGDPLATTTNLANGTFKFDAIAYGHNDIGKTYRYVVLEKIPDGASLDTSSGKYVLNGVTYANTKFVVEVAITDNGDGTLNTAVTGNGTQNIHFINEYRSVPASVQLPGKKTLKDRNLTEGEFKFALYGSDSGFISRNLLNDEITHDIKGKFNISFGTLDMGYHYFVVKEIIPEERAVGIHYDASEYYITIQVIDSGNGRMSALTTVKHSGDPNAVNPEIAFNNIYQPEPGELVLSGTKTYNGGKTLEDNVFSVGLYQGAVELDTAFVKANGDFIFQAVQYTAADLGQTYTYTVKEIIPDGATENADGTFTFGNDIYDGTVYTVEVTITDTDKDGALEIVKTVTQNGDPVDELTFTNTFVPDPITHIVKAKKTYEKGLKGNDFEFKLTSSDNKTDVDQTKENAANGDIIFDAITFSAAGEYKFKLTEKKDSILSFILPSQAEYEITITVVNENGVLRVSNVETVNTKNTGETNLEFINTYVLDGEDEITLRGTKKLTGDRTQVKANEFEFGLYDAAGDLIESVKNDADGNFAFTTLKFDETDVPVSGQKQITYTVKEIKGSDIRVTYDETVYTVVVTVKDNEQGGVTASYTVNSEAEGLITFTNIYTPKPEDITVDFDIVKTVVNKGSEKIGPEGFEFLLNALADGVADITVKADENGKAKFTLTFTEDDIGNTYTYKLTEVNGDKANVTYCNAEYTITVAIELNENNELVAILTKNSENVTAVVAAFENVYNYTPPKTDNPKTGDNTNLQLWFALLFVSCGAMVTLAVYNKKRSVEETE